MLSIAKRINNSQAESYAHSVLGFIQRKKGNRKGAIDLFEKSWKAADRAGDGLLRARQQDNIAEIHFVSNKLNEALNNSKVAYETASRYASGWDICYHGLTHGWVLIGLNRSEEAIPVLMHSRQQPIPYVQHQVLVTLAIAQLRAGKLDEASKTLEEAVEYCQQMIERSRSRYVNWHMLGLAYICLSLIGQDKYAEALSAYSEACKISTEKGVIERQLVLLSHADSNNHSQVAPIRDYLKTFL
jgi:tetratricopeptide (TPR) repeat protein